MGRLAQKYDKFEKLNTEIVPILVDKLENAQKMEKKYAKEKFPILYDQKNEVAKQLKQQKKFWKLGRLPGMLIVDKAGIIQFAYYSDSMSDIPKNKTVLEVIRSFAEDNSES